MSAEAEELCNEGLELMSRHAWAEAEKKMNLAVQEDDESPELWYNLGKCRFHQDKYNDARRALTQALELRQRYPEAWALKGSCFYALNEAGAAEACFALAAQEFKDEALKRECWTAEAHCRLAVGELGMGFKWYQKRLKEPDTWDGTQSLVGKTLLIKAEGGLGDQIFFSRYSDLVTSLGVGYALWECDEPLDKYLSWNMDTVIRGKESPEYDYMVHAGSLPYIFGTKLGTIPQFSVGRGIVDAPTHIGIACSGNPLHPDDHHRSIPLAEFNPLTELLDKEFYIVQQHLRESDKKTHAGGPYRGLETFETVEDLGSFLNTLDLVITVDTMTAHLAGAEGIPTWLLLPYACDWRWKLEGDRTPWYPCMRIFRQGPDRQWAPVIQRVVEELKNG